MIDAHTLKILKLRDYYRPFGYTISFVSPNYKVYKKGFSNKSNRNWTGSDVVFISFDIQQVIKYLKDDVSR